MKMTMQNLWELQLFLNVVFFAIRVNVVIFLYFFLQFHEQMCPFVNTVCEYCNMDFIRGQVSSASYTWVLFTSEFYQRCCSVLSAH